MSNLNCIKKWEFCITRRIICKSFRVAAILNYAVNAYLCNTLYKKRIICISFSVAETLKYAV